MGYLVPTPIQESAIPQILKGQDVFGCAHTGTGKTAAFALPLLQLLELNPSNRAQRHIRVLALAPTRELAQQINTGFADFGSKLGFRHAVVFGGVSQHSQVQQLRKGVDILVATPGRLLDLVQQGIIRLSEVEYLVLDEADRMLDMGFIHDIKRILRLVPSKRQTLFFSATVTPDVKLLSETILHKPLMINVVQPTSQKAVIEQSVYFVKKEDKRGLLRFVLTDPDIEHALVFTRTRRGADRVVKELVRTGIKASAIHGDKSQSAREKALSEFKNRSIRVLVATDVASRGIDIDRISHVINFEIPEQVDTYTHRIGRTGRAGASGKALSFCAAEEQNWFKDIRKLNPNKIKVINEHPFHVGN